MGFGLVFGSFFWCFWMIITTNHSFVVGSLEFALKSQESSLMLVILDIFCQKKLEKSRAFLMDKFTDVNHTNLEA